MNKLILALILSIFLSCKNYKTIHDKVKINIEEINERDDTKCMYTLCVIIENSMDKETITIDDFNNYTLVLDKVQLEFNGKQKLCYFIKNNPSSYKLIINNKSFYIKGNVNREFKYLILRKIKKYIYMIYTNKYNESFKDLCNDSKNIYK